MVVARLGLERYSSRAERTLEVRYVSTLQADVVVELRRGGRVLSLKRARTRARRTGFASARRAAPAATR
ncbi:MAG: hypothetical protein ACRDPC_21715 [Solirubrobacteraceae bacterium]